jgi:membrane-associated phospholipid phosphatase
MAKPKAALTSHLQPQAHAAIALSALVLFSLMAREASLHMLKGWESNVFYHIYHLPQSWVPLLVAITQLGSVWVIPILVLVAYAHKMYKLAFKLTVNGAIAVVAVEYIKHIVARPRPGGLVDGVTQRGLHVNGYGFPSGHTTIVTVMALTLLPYIPRKYQWAPWLAIVLVAFSRVYLGVHSPLDVLGGFALGIMIASLQHTFTTTRHQIVNHPAYQKRKKVKNLKR